MGNFFRVVLERVVGVLFPAHCVSCSAYGEWWCTRCRESAETLTRDVCASCASVKREHECSTLVLLDGLVVSGFYHDPRLRAVIQQLKYKGATCLLPSIALFCRNWRDVRVDPWPWAGLSDLVIQPLIGAPAKVRERGFDQARLIADIARESIVPWARPVDLLDRRDNPQTQASLAVGPLRAANVSNVFSIKADTPIPSNILLVDDVLTTGSTMREAARVLRKAGAKKIFGFALAVGK